MQASPALLTVQLPPGPRGLPVLGSLPFLVKAPTHHSLNRLAKQHGDVCLFYIGNVPTVVISHPRLMAEAFEQADLGEGGIARHILTQVDSGHDPGHDSGEDAWDDEGYGTEADGTAPALAPHGDRWRYLHRFTTEKLFGPEGLQMLERHHVEPMVDELAERLGRLADAGKTVNPMADFDHLEYNLTFRAVFGASCHDSLDFLSLKSQLREHISWDNDVATTLNPSDFLSWFKGSPRKLEREAERLKPDRDRILAGLLNGVRQRPDYDPSAPNCLAEVMLAAQSAGDLEWAEVRSLCSGILSVAPSGLAKSLSWLLLLLANRPEIQAGVHEEIDRVLGWGAVPDTEDLSRLPYTFACLAESMRYRTTSPPSIPRRAARDTEAGGFQIPAGAQVLGNIYAVHHDDRFWASPLRFLPERFMPGPDGSPAPALTNGAFMPFGTGHRACTGRALAETSTWLHASRLLSRLRFETPDETPLPEVEVFDRTLCKTIVPQPYDLKVTRRW